MSSKLEIDYSGIVEEAPIVKNTWRPPRHVFFGKRDPDTGMMEEEPVYVHQEYPRMLYFLKNKKIVAMVVKSDEERDKRLEEGWVKTPAEFGYVGAPSFEELHGSAPVTGDNVPSDEEITEGDTAPRRGRPPKKAA